MSLKSSRGQWVNSPVTSEFPSQRPVMWSFDVFFDLRLNKQLSKQSWGWWFEMPSCLLWLHCNVCWEFTFNHRFPSQRANTIESVMVSKECSTKLAPSYSNYHCLKPLRWRHNDHDGVSNHQPHGCLLNRLFRCRSKKTSKLRITGLCVGNSPGLVNSPHKGPVTRKMFPFDDVIMNNCQYLLNMSIRSL